MASGITEWILKPEHRWKVMEHIKTPMRAALIGLIGLYPTPTKENTLLHNSHILIDVQEAFLKCIVEATYKNGAAQRELWTAIWKLLIIEYEHDPDYRYPFEVILKELVKRVNSGDWKPSPQPRPPHWKNRVLEFDE